MNYNLCSFVWAHWHQCEKVYGVMTERISAKLISVRDIRINKINLLQFTENCMEFDWSLLLSWWLVLREGIRNNHCSTV